jgi:hypothetical protein
MTHSTDSETDAPGRYVGRESDNGTVTIIDAENEDAWIRSDTTMALFWQT